MFALIVIIPLLALSSTAFVVSFFVGRRADRLSREAAYAVGLSDREAGWPTHYFDTGYYRGDYWRGYRSHILKKGFY